MTRARSVGRELFPVGLYGCLLCALLCLVRPEYARTAESACASVMCLPFRAYSLLLATAAAHAAADGADTAEAATVAAADRRVEELRGRRARQLAASLPDAVGAGLEPFACRVVERRDRGAAGRDSVLVLDRGFDEIGAAERFATVGDALIGFLPEPTARRPGDPARIELLHHRRDGALPRRVPARVLLVEGRQLDFLVEPAGRIDAWPLRCALSSDPYLAAGIALPDLPVRTMALALDPLGTVPPDLRIGTLKVFGYAEPGGSFLPIGLFVQPAVDVRAVNEVVLWRRAPSAPSAPSASSASSAPGAASGPGAPAPPADALQGGDLVPVRLLRLPGPGPARDRWFATTVEAALRLPRDAALVHGRRLIGVLATAGWGYAVVSPFGRAGSEWPVTLLPDDPAAAPVDFVAQDLRRDGAFVVLRPADPAVVPALRAGQLFTGTRGRDCPAGLWIGAAAPDPHDPAVLWVRHVEAPPESGLAVYRRSSARGSP